MKRNFQDLTEDIDVNEHVADVEHLVKALLEFHQHRESTYQMSFAQRGLVGVWMNLGRKYDRIDKLAENFHYLNQKRYTLGDGGKIHGKPLVDTLVDTAIYALKWLAIISKLEILDETDYGMESWVRDVFAEELGLDYAEAAEWIYRDVAEASSEIKNPHWPPSPEPQLEQLYKMRDEMPEDLFEEAQAILTEAKRNNED